MNNTQKVYQLGQSIWYDNIQRRLLENGEMVNMINQGEIYGVTSNPSIFNNAITKSHDYDDDLIPLVKGRKSAEEIFEILAVEDIRNTADLFLDIYKSSNYRDGYVSFEVNPDLANDTDATCKEAKRLWDLVDRPNLMIKIPATKEGLPAITRSIENGLNVNVTLIFSQERYEDVMDAYLSGIEARIADGNQVDRIASVASFFVSRIDTKTDKYIDDIISTEEMYSELAKGIQGKVAIANARLTYQRFKSVFEGERFESLKEKGARTQRPLWASTSTKNTTYSDVLYIDNLIGQDTVNTVPPKTLQAFNHHGSVNSTLEKGLFESQEVLDKLQTLGISLNRVTQELEIEGVSSFKEAFQNLLSSIETRRREILA